MSPDQQTRGRFQWDRGTKKARKAPPVTPTGASTQEAPDRDTPIHISKDELFSMACNFEAYSNPNIAPGFVVRKGLDNFDDLTIYGVADGQQKELWKIEIARLTAVVANPDQHLHFPGSADFNLDSKLAHTRFATLADTMHIALHLTFHDSQGLIHNKYPRLVMDKSLSKTRRILNRFLASRDNSDRDDPEDEAHKSDVRPERDETSPNPADFFNLVDYVTATLARIVCRSWFGGPSHKKVLVKLAKMAAKMKIVSSDLHKHAAISFVNAPTSQDGTRHIQYGDSGARGDAGDAGGGRGMSEALEGVLATVGRQSQEDTSDGPPTGLNALTRFYYRDELCVQGPVFLILRSLIVSLRGEKAMWTSLSTSYEICGMLYNMGLDNSPVLLFRDIDGDHLGTSDDEAINVSQASFVAIDSAVKGIRRRRSPGLDAASVIASSPPPVDIAKDRAMDASAPIIAPLTSQNAQTNMDHQLSVGTTITWYYEELDDSNESESSRNTRKPAIHVTQPMRMRLRTMSDVITVMVPLCLASPDVIIILTKFLNILIYSESRTHADGLAPVLYRQTDFKASFCLTTEEYQKIWRDHPHRDEVSTLSSSLVTRDMLLSWKLRRAKSGTIDIDTPLLPTSAHPVSSVSRESHLGNSEEDRQLQLSRKQLDHAFIQMSKWVFEENGVRVRCDWFVGVVSTLAAVLVVGGITAGLTLGERLPGVDPFNIATFTWVLAAFVILVAKSMRVSSWTWWDFLHRQVLCRSVSELRAVTGIDEQLILARLLHDESQTPLLTQGPYNTVFTRKANGGGGFAIDRPPEIRTMLLSGLVMIVAQAPSFGRFLVCMDLRKGTGFQSILRTSDQDVDKEERIVSNRLDDKQSSGKDRRIFLKTKKATWIRIIGVYGKKDAVFC